MLDFIGRVWVPCSLFLQVSCSIAIRFRSSLFFLLNPRASNCGPIWNLSAEVLAITLVLSFQKDWIKVAEFNRENGLWLSLSNENFPKRPTPKKYSDVLTACLSSEIPVFIYICISCSSLEKGCMGDNSLFQL